MEEYTCKNTEFDCGGNCQCGVEYETITTEYDQGSITNNYMQVVETPVEETKLSVSELIARALVFSCGVGIALIALKVIK